MLFHCEAASIYVCVLIRCIMHNVIVYLIPNLRRWPGDCVVGASQRGTSGGCLGIPQGDLHKILTRHKQQIFSCRIEKMASVKFLHVNIGPDIDLVCPTGNFFVNTMMTSNWMIKRTCSIQAGKVKLLFATLCACRLFWHPALTKLQC